MRCIVGCAKQYDRRHGDGRPKHVPTICWVAGVAGDGTDVVDFSRDHGVLDPRLGEDAAVDAAEGIEAQII